MDTPSKRRLTEKIESIALRSEFNSDIDSSAGASLGGLEIFSKIIPTRVDTVEIRPAAVRNICQFLNTLSNKCKADLAKLGCGKHLHHTAQEANNPGNAANPSTKRKQSYRDREPWEKRLQRLKVYQRVFSAIVIHFKAYCPVLFYIKKTYEDMLSYRINQIKQAHFEKKRLHIQKRNMRHQMIEYKYPESSQPIKLEKYLHILRQRIGLQDEAIKVITGILNKMEESLSDHFERHRDLEEQIIMVDTEITNRRQKAFVMRGKEEKEAVKEKDGQAGAAENNTLTLFDEEDEEEDKDDPFYNVEEVDEERKMVWIMAIAICHKDLEDAEKKLNLYQTKFQHVVPRRDQESTIRKIKEEKLSAKELADEKSSLEEELVALNLLL